MYILQSTQAATVGLIIGVLVWKVWEFYDKGSNVR